MVSRHFRWHRVPGQPETFLWRGVGDKHSELFRGSLNDLIADAEAAEERAEFRE